MRKVEFKKKKISEGWTLNKFLQCKSSYWLTVPEDADVEKIKDLLRTLPGARKYCIEAEIYKGKEIYFTSSLGFKEAYQALVPMLGFEYTPSGPNQGSIKQRKRVKQYTLDGEFVREWESLKDAERECGYASSSITNAARGRTKTAYGFRWIYSS